MPHDSTTTGRGLWRILVLDRDHSDPKWLLATIAPGDVRPATGPGAELDQVTVRWVASASGLYRPAFTALPHPQVWLISEQPREGT